MDIFSMLGWVGTVLVVGAYFLNSTKRLGSASRTYQLMNLFGAVGVGFSTYHQAAWPAVMLQLIWGMIAIWSLLKKE